MPEQDLVCGAADADQIDALRPLLLRERQELAVARRHNKHLGERRLVSVDHDIDLVPREDPQVHAPPDG